MSAIAHGEQAPITTLAVSNIPLDLRRHAILAGFRKIGFCGSLDFLYVLVRGREQCVIVNFASSADAAHFLRLFDASLVVQTLAWLRTMKVRPGTSQGIVALFVAKGFSFNQVKKQAGSVIGEHAQQVAAHIIADFSAALLHSANTASSSTALTDPEDMDPLSHISPRVCLDATCQCDDIDAEMVLLARLMLCEPSVPSPAMSVNRKVAAQPIKRVWRTWVLQSGSL